jgi:hypothetical protein
MAWAHLSVAKTGRRWFLLGADNPPKLKTIVQPH